MATLSDLCIPYLLHHVTTSKDTSALIEWLRDGGTVTPELSLLIADILEGKLKAKPKKIKKTSIKRRPAIQVELEYHQKNLREFKKLAEENPKGEPIIDLGDGYNLSWAEMKNSLERAGYNGSTDTKGEITMAAKYLVAHSRGLSINQLDEIFIKRQRKK